MISARGLKPSTFLHGVETSLPILDLLSGSVLQSRAEELRGRSVLLITTDQLSTALALIELDGLVSRIVLYPPDVPLEHLRYILNASDVSAIVSDRTDLRSYVVDEESIFLCGETVLPCTRDEDSAIETEWVLLTSGTTGVPKLVVHTLATLTSAFKSAIHAQTHCVWSTFYDIRRYGGLQIFLRALATGTSLVLSSVEESTTEFLVRAGVLRVTHISGTPSHWRGALMSSSAHVIRPVYVRLSGEIADQAILNNLQTTYPQARISHAFASTEAGVAFEIEDKLTGFPESVLSGTPGMDMKIVDCSLRIRSASTAVRYLGDHAGTLTDADGYVDTCDLLELRGGRYRFVGRRDGIINVGGLKVHPEEVEAVINHHPVVQMSLVRSKKSPVTGALVVADVVLRNEPASVSARELEQELFHLCREMLSPYKVPAAFRFVPSLEVNESGKLKRFYA